VGGRHSCRSEVITAESRGRKRENGPVSNENVALTWERGQIYFLPKINLSPFHLANGGELAGVFGPRRCIRERVRYLLGLADDLPHLEVPLAHEAFLDRVVQQRD